MCRLLCPPCRQMGTAGHSHLHATDSAKLLVFSSSAENGRVVLSGPPALGAGGPEFKSRRPDQNISRVFFRLSKAYFTQNRPWNFRRQEVSIRKSFNSKEFAARRIFKNTRRQECYSETIERRQVKRAPSGKYGENRGDPVHFSTHQSSEMQIGDHALGPARASQRLSICVLNRPVKSRQVKPTLR